MVATSSDHNDVYALSAGARIRISNVVALTGEYFYVFPNQIKSQISGSKVRNTFTAGLKIYTGNHTFQIFIYQCQWLEREAIPYGKYRDWLNKGIHIGFNFTRLFQVAHY